MGLSEQPIRRRDIKEYAEDFEFDAYQTSLLHEAVIKMDEVVMKHRAKSNKPPPQRRRVGLKGR